MSASDVAYISDSDILRLLEVHQKKQYDIVRCLQFVIDDDQRNLLKNELASSNELIKNIIIFIEITFLKRKMESSTAAYISSASMSASAASSSSTFPETENVLLPNPQEALPPKNEESVLFQRGAQTQTPGQRNNSESKSKRETKGKRVAKDANAEEAIVTDKEFQPTLETLAISEEKKPDGVKKRGRPRLSKQQPL